MSGRTALERNKQRAAKSQTKNPIFSKFLLQSIYIGTYTLVARSTEEADVIIEPRAVHIDSEDFHHTQECIRQSEIVAQKPSSRERGR